MNKIGLKIIVLGCILLMISGLFLPFVSVSGYTTTLFGVNKELNYIPYILIGFSLISIIVILLNKKIEFAYLLIGSSLTFLITTTIDSIEDFKYFSIGYYLILISTILLFLMLILLNTKSEDEIIKKEESVLDVKESIDFENIEPNELAKSIMDQPVMNNENINSVPIEPNFNEINSEEVTLAPQNPLNSFLPSDFDPSKIVKEEKQVIQNEEKSVKEDTNQSIMSVMSQPMVNSNLNTTPIIEPDISNLEQKNVVSNVHANVPNGFSNIGTNIQNQTINSVPKMNPNMQTQPLNNIPELKPSMVNQPLNEEHNFNNL